MLQVFREIKVSGFDGSLYETKQVFYSSKDGTRIPMYIVHKKVRAWIIISMHNYLYVLYHRKGYLQGVNIIIANCKVSEI